MNNESKENFDVIIVGSGTCGSTIARELCKQKKRVLVLERGGNNPLKETFMGVAGIANQVSVSDKLNEMRALTTGGTTSLYFAVADPPPIDTFKSLGIDLSQDFDDIRNELPICELPDNLLGAQALKLRDSAESLGYSWKKNKMLIDQSKCNSGYSYEAKWKAKSYMQDALNYGAHLINRALVSKIIIDNKKAIGVEYKIGNSPWSKTSRAYGSKIILSAGALASPFILKNSGLKNVGCNGFYIDPNIVLFGSVPGLIGKDNFVGSMYTKLNDDIALGDANVPRLFYKLMMLAKMKPFQIASYNSSIAIGVKVKDAMSGGLRENGCYYKKLTDDVFKKLKVGEDAAVKILKNAGAKNIFNAGINAGGVGGLLQIKEHLDENLQTEFENLYVCDHSLMPESSRVAPTLTLICLAKYLSRKLLTAI